ncbi:2Fe-2S iron-sulfur cluster binding domain-containing protein [Paenibacillus abyssi]|uniref:2Fe-2S ferredoxin-type domain-containing protein n=1 Tax=Paenibacillus abyssi TaxID=1340531 RepID=A0A917FQ82_9BACL|nr:2Fe-2S iron-sulfur cluster-binding protein [Paenibacillus abyssi]GGF94503.1 hypothetical protein GCM10010916_09820 [Paenibacillus abyssi]
MKYVRIRVVHNQNKAFSVQCQSGSTLLQLVNQHVDDPKTEGIPYLCNKGACRSCTIEILENGELLDEPTRLEQRSLSVGRTAIDRGYRLACLSYFKGNCERP